MKTTGRVGSRARQSHWWTLAVVALWLSTLFPLGYSVPVLADRSEYAFFELNAKDQEQMADAIRAIELHGGRCRHRFPFGACIGELPPSAEASLSAEGLVVGVHRGAVSPSDLRVTDDGTEAALEAWLRIRGGPVRLAPVTGPEPEPPPGDMKFRPPTTEGSGPGTSAFPARSQTSEFFIGSVAVAVIFPESDGSIDPATETWSRARQDESIAEIAAAMNWWAEREPRANLSFVYRAARSVPIGYEPINRPQSDEGLWVGQAMTNLGYASGDYISRVQTYVSDLREALETDWAFAAFVVDDLNDADNKFADKWFAYAYVGGPFLVMTYGNNGYGPTNMRAVAAHETGHIFSALDEYSGGPACDVRSGYLDVANSNSVVPSANGGCGMNQSCLMRGQISPYNQASLCPASRGQLGWRDSDADGILDPMDTGLTLTARYSGFQVLPGGRIARLYTGQAADVPWPSPSHRPASLNRVAGVEFRVDEDEWRVATPQDGQWDGPEEEFNFAVEGLSDGVHCTAVRTTNSVGNRAYYSMTELTKLGTPSISYLPLIRR